MPESPKRATTGAAAHRHARKAIEAIRSIFSTLMDENKHSLSGVWCYMQIIKVRGPEEGRLWSLKGLKNGENKHRPW